VHVLLNKCPTLRRLQGAVVAVVLVGKLYAVTCPNLAGQYFPHHTEPRKGHCYVTEIEIDQRLSQVIELIDFIELLFEIEEAELTCGRAHE